jgi:hypothetical protein
MDDELKKRFFRQKITDFVTDNLKPFPTIICERDDPKISDLVRRYCLFANKMVPFKVGHNLLFVEERLDIQRGTTDFGDLYIYVNVN